MKKIPLKEKIRLTSGQSNWHFFESDYVDGRKINVADGPHGVRVYGKPVEDGDFLSKRYLTSTTLFPSASAMASTWNKSLIKTAGATIGQECRYHQVDVLLGPGINLKRSPLGGRNFEYYSEDPYLTSEIAQSFVHGVQSENVGACIKHFGLNEQETMRRFVDVKVDERTFHEMYLYPFYKVIKKENPWMVMSSYNKLNGHYASESSHLLQDVLRKQWDYKGAVISDWGAVQDKVKSLKNGMNVEMPGPSSFEEEVLEAVDNNQLDEKTIDHSLQPLFDLHEKVKKIKRIDDLDLDAHHSIAKNVAAEAIVLLENDGILPVKDQSQKVAVIGQFAKEPRINGGGSATVKPYKQEIPYDEFSNLFDHIAYAQGYDENDTSSELITEAKKLAKSSDLVFYFTGTTDVIETEGKDRDHLSLPEGHLTLFRELIKVNDNIVVILSNGSALDLREIKSGSRAILETWFLGGAAGQAIADIVVGNISPSGRLQETFPLKVEHTPHYGTFAPLVEVDYHHDLIMNGYRYYDTHQYDVLYPFGYGLSYANIEYQDITWSKHKSKDSSYMTAQVTVKNTSDVDSYQTVQVYIKATIDHLMKPSQELKAFEKVMIHANETKTVTIEIPLDAFETYSEKEHQFVVYNGTYEIRVGQHSRDIIFTKEITIDDQLPYVPYMDINYPVKFLELFFPKWFVFIEEQFRPLWWHEKEEPIWRVFDRYRRHKGIKEEEYTKLMEQLKEDINV